MSDERLKELSALATYQFAAIFNEKNTQMTIGEIVEKLYDNDLVRVVRCKDCIYYRETNDETYCNRNWWNDEWHRTYPDEYCSCGERKETE